jgi:hypothetical protein
LTHVDKSGDDLTLTFEDEIVYWLSQYNKAKKAARSKVTRAEFIDSMVREVKEITIPFYCPELHVKQPITGTSSKTKATDTATKDAKRQGGFASDSKITVKHSGATKTQRDIIEKVLDVGDSLSAPGDVLVMAVMCITQESVAGADPDPGAGPFSRTSPGGSQGVEKDAHDFYKGGAAFEGGGALASYRKYHGKQSLGWMVSDVQRDYTWGTAGQGKDFQQWKDEAQRTVRLYGGSAGLGVSDTNARQKLKRYEYSRGRPGGPAGENTWGCGLRLAEEVAWRFFAALGTLYYISETELMTSRTRLTVNQTTPGVEDVDFEWNITSKKDVPPSEITITARADRWGVPPGALIEVEEYGPANGWWLISNIKRGLFDPICTITCKQPTNPKAEPAPEEASSSSDGGSTETVSGSKARLNSDGTVTPPADAPEKVQAVIRAANAIHTKPYSYGAGHGQFNDSAYDCSSAVSFALHGGDLISAPQASPYFINSWGEAGGGKWITTYASENHMYMEVCGLRFDTSRVGNSGGTKPGGSGPRWQNAIGKRDGFTARHPKGL